MGRKIAAVVLGTIVAFAVIAIIQTISVIFFYPLPEGVTMRDKAAMEAHIKGLPIGAFIFVLVAYAVGTVAGVAAATRFARSAGPGYVVGALLLIASLVNLASFWHPSWFWVASIAIVAGATYGMTRPESLGTEVARAASPQ